MRDTDQITSPVTRAEETIRHCDAVLNVANSLMVSHIRMQVYQERIAQGWQPDNDAASFMHVHQGAFGTQERMANTRNIIVDALEQRYAAQYIRDTFLDAMHKATHEVIGECMYTVGWDDEANTEILSQPCSYWTDAPVRNR